jgi:pyruvate/2-oxoacid:ferredoxin oxidoreductase beta subunit/Pyruvate/2-oxoacid:ferredoxin oxidoreductase gamma subunit
MGAATYLASDAKLPYCRGCGHGLVVRQLSKALERLALPGGSVVLTTDIGCVGLADPLFPYLHTVHTTHGRSTAMATGMALAEAVLPAAGLKPIVMIGDGGATIGLLHLVHAAQLNVDITVLVHNNFMFGMTGGQHSAFTPLDWVTSTTPEGNCVPPLDLLALLRAAHGGFLARQFATDSNLDEVIAAAISFPGFSLVEILEVCTGYGVTKNKLTGNALRELASRQGYSIGRMETKGERPTFNALHRYAMDSRAPRKPAPEFSSLPVKSSLTYPLRIVIAGTAGERVQSSAALLCRAALSAGLYSTQKNDNPVTQGSGFSLSEICLSPQAIEYTGLESVDVIIAASQEGWDELRANGTLAKATPRTLLLLDAGLEIPAPVAPGFSQACRPEGRRYEGLLRQPFRQEATPKRAALAAVACWLAMNPVVPGEAWDAVVAVLPAERREDVAAALQIGKSLATQGGLLAA